MNIAVIAALSAAAYWEFRENLNRSIDNYLISQAKSVTVSIATDDSLLEARKEIQAFFGPKDDPKGTIYRIWFEGEKEYYADSFSGERWPLDLKLESVEPPKEGEFKFFSTERDDVTYRLLWASQSAPRFDDDKKQPLNIIIAAYNGYIAEQLGEFLTVLLIIGFIIIFLSIGLTLLILRWGLKPIHGITALMHNVTGKNIDQLSPQLDQEPSELQPFVQAWDNMIERLSMAIQQQKRFTADASHELRTPLAIVKSTLQATRSRKRSEEDYESSIDRALEDIDRLEHLIEQLLLLAHLDDIKRQTQYQKIDLQTLVTDVCEQYLPLAQQNGNTLKWQVCPAKIEGDQHQLNRMLANLIDNAIKYGPEKGQISISMKSSDKTVSIKVHDRGGNISKNQQEHIFERFYRIRKTRQKSSGGTGLGLALVREIALRHNGTIQVSSNPENGTEFTVNLPLIS